jgi:uncharacterized protein (TIGR03000 family)
MYSLVLLAALSAGPDSAANWCHGCHGCYGCYGGYGCYGCCGCYGGYGCCCGGYGYYDCYSCHGCYGCYGCYGCTGYWGCYGCYGYSGCHAYYPPAYWSPPAVAAPVVGAPVGPAGGAAETPPAGAPKTGGKPDEVSLNRAKLVVEVPADARLYIDDQPMKTTAARRVFSTPALEPGQAYYYMVRVEVLRDGKVQSETKRVIVRAGEEVRADFARMDVTPTVTAAAGIGR